MIHLYSSNRLEWLAGKLAESMESESVFESETVIVQSRGMERWLKLQLAASTGICANITCPFPKLFIIDCLNRITGMPLGDRFSKDILRWRIYEFFTLNPIDTEFAIPVNYLTGTNKTNKTYQLANRVANLYDEYQTFRPNSICSWSGSDKHPFTDPVFEASEHEMWQRRLWQELYKEVGEKTLSEQLIEFMALELEPETLGLPKRIHLFGISALPPIFMSFFEKLATVVDLRIFYLTPCQEFWEDCVQEEYKLQQELLSEEETYWEVGNPLLSSMGILGRDFSRLINSLENVAGESSRFFTDTLQNVKEPVPNSERTLLHTLQNDMLTLDNRCQSSDKFVLRQEDTSIRIHVCHSPMREIEVLYDQVLAALNENSSLAARDILVMTPDVATYAPYIKAVFDNPEESRLQIPYSIADKTPGQDNPVAAAFLAILNLHNTRFTVADVLEIFEVEAVHNSFGISAEDLVVVRRWVHKSGIRWGADAEFKEGLDLPNISQNTWTFGFDRLLMGYAMPQLAGITENILPMDIEGKDADMLGRFIEFWSGLNQVRKEQVQNSERSIDQWEAFLGSVIDSFFVESTDASEDLRAVWFAVNRLVENLIDSGVTCTISREAIFAELTAILNDDTAGTGFLHGGVTFCRLRPMRSIPAKMICLIGMNEGEFPRQNKGVGFDLMTSKRYPGDRNNRLDDRYLFLESVISAREKLYLSYIGRSIKDNSILPPSILVSELVDYIEQSTKIQGQTEKLNLTCRQLLFIEHPLQAFSRRYFDQSHPERISFSASNCRGAAQVGALFAKYSAESHNQGDVGGVKQEFLAAVNFQSKAKGASQKNEISLRNLIRFFEHPAKFYIRDILDTRLGRQELVKPEEDEPFIWDSRDFFRNAEIIAGLIEHKNTVGPDDCYERFKGAGEMPPGLLGKKEFFQHFKKLQDFSGKIVEYYGGQTTTPVSISLDLGEDLFIQGVVPNLLPSKGILNYRYAKTREKLYLRTWIEGLCLNCQEAVPVPATVVYLNGQGNTIKVEELVFPEAEQCLNLLKNLVALYEIGTEKPVPFFPKTSMTFTQEFEQDPAMVDVRTALHSSLPFSNQHFEKCKEKVLSAAQKKWLPLFNFPGECDDIYNSKAFGEFWFQEARMEEVLFFCTTALTVFKPLLESIASAEGDKQ